MSVYFLITKWTKILTEISYNWILLLLMFIYKHLFYILLHKKNVAPYFFSFYIKCLLFA